jgi:hypothetical protein
LNLIARTDELDLAIKDEHSTVANDSEGGHLRTDSRAGWSGQSNKLRGVKDSE